jgi:hypothetical protein
MKKLLCRVSLGAMLPMTMVHALPVWTFTPLTATNIAVAPTETATIQYTVTNKSTLRHSLVMTPIPAITQLTTGPGVCGNPILLPTQNSSCTLSLQVNGSQLTRPITDGPVLCEHGNPLQCDRPSLLNILRITSSSTPPPTPTTTISVNATGTIPASLAGTTTNTVTVTNTGTDPAFNVRATLPVGWTAVTQDDSNCAFIAPNGGTCTLIFSSTQAYIAEGNILVTGDNIVTPPTMALAFTVQNELVWSISPSIQVIDTADLGSSVWSSVNVVTGALSLTDGFANTALINANGAIQPTAAQGCFNSTAGGAVAGTWYLPAICELGPAGLSAACPAGLANIDTNLFQLGFGGLSDGGPAYWSSTEFSSTDAWLQVFASGGGTIQFPNTKFFVLPVRCARTVTLS